MNLSDATADDQEVSPAFDTPGGCRRILIAYVPELAVTRNAGRESCLSDVASVRVVAYEI